MAEAPSYDPARDLDRVTTPDNYLSTSHLRAPVQNGWNGLKNDADVIVGMSFMLGVIVQIATEADGKGGFWYWRWRYLNGGPWMPWGKMTGPSGLPDEAFPMPLEGRKTKAKPKAKAKK